jgi:hypothetical protein
MKKIIQKLFFKITRPKIISKQLTEKQIQILRKKIIILGELIVVLSIVVLFLAALLNVGI